MKTTDIYGEVPENVHNAVISALDEINSEKTTTRRKIRFSTGLIIAAVICVVTTITVAAVSLYNKDLVEDIYFDRDVTHNLIMDMNPQYDAYLTEEGIEQLENFEPVALDVIDYSGNGNDLKSATLLGVMADKYTMTSLIEVTFNKDISVPEDNVAMMARGTLGAAYFFRYTTEDKNLRYGDVPFNVGVQMPYDSYQGFFDSFEPIEAKSKDENVYTYLPNEVKTNISIIPVADKPNTVVVYIEEHRADEGCAFEKNSTVRYILEDFGIMKAKGVWESLSDGKYIFDIPTPKKLIPVAKTKVNEEFIYEDCKYTIKSLERSQSYIQIDYTCEMTPEFYENAKNPIEYPRRAGNEDTYYEFSIEPPYVEVHNEKGRKIPTGISGNSSGWRMPDLYSGNEFPHLDANSEHTAIIHFMKPQNDESVSELVFRYNDEREVYRIPLK